VTLGGSAGAIAVARVLLGDVPDFHVEALPYPSLGTVPVHLALGVVVGCLGVAYNRTILGTLAVADRLRHWPVELRAALIGSTVSLLAWFAPGLVGGGDAITQRTLDGAESVAMVSVVFLRFGLAPYLMHRERRVDCSHHACSGVSEQSSLALSAPNGCPTWLHIHGTGRGWHSGVFHRRRTTRLRDHLG
jgi:hypothetical protein